MRLSSRRFPLPSQVPTALLAAAWALLGPAAAALAGPLDVRVTDAAGRPLAGAVVFLESREAHDTVRPAQGIEIAQAGKQFVPQVTVVPVGSAVTFPNRDTVRHHVYSFSPVTTVRLNEPRRA
jgi:plastocyanin